MKTLILILYLLFLQKKVFDDDLPKIKRFVGSFKPMSFTKIGIQNLPLLICRMKKDLFKIIAIKNIKNTKPTLLNLMIFMLKKKNVSKKYDKQRASKGKCFNYGKPGHYSKDCKQKPSKLKNKFNMLNIDDKDQEELFRILESNNSFDSLEDDYFFLI